MTVSLDQQLQTIRDTRFRYVNYEGGRESNEGIHCPTCDSFRDEEIYELGDVYTEGDSTITCPDCNTDYVVTTAIEYTFVSIKVEE